MKFLLKPVLALALLAMLATSAKAQDTLKITLKEAIRIALSENPTIKVADHEIQLKKEANREVIWELTSSTADTSPSGDWNIFCT